MVSAFVNVGQVRNPVDWGRWRIPLLEAPGQAVGIVRGRRVHIIKTRFVVEAWRNSRCRERGNRWRS